MIASGVTPVELVLGVKKKNKTSSAVHCLHPPSGAKGYSEDSRSQLQNRQQAFVRMAESKEFKQWHRLEVSRKTGELDRITREVDRQMRNIKIEIKEDGVWTEVDKDKELTDEQ